MSKFEKQATMPYWTLQDDFGHVLGLDTSVKNLPRIALLSRELTLAELLGLRDMLDQVNPGDRRLQHCANDTDDDDDCGQCARFNGCPIQKALAR